MQPAAGAAINLALRRGEYLPTAQLISVISRLVVLAVRLIFGALPHKGPNALNPKSENSPGPFATSQSIYIFNGEKYGMSRRKFNATSTFLVFCFPSICSIFDLPIQLSCHGTCCCSAVLGEGRAVATENHLRSLLSVDHPMGARPVRIESEGCHGCKQSKGICSTRAVRAK